MKIIGILHNIRSVHNVGSMFRTADALGIQKLYLTGITPEPVDRFGEIRSQFGKVALGAEKSVLWEKCTQITPLLRRLKKDGYILCAIEQHKKSTPYYTVKSKRDKLDKVALIVGNEVDGIPPSTLKSADEILEIPMLGKKESLNVSAAFAITAAHLRHE